MGRGYSSVDGTENFYPEIASRFSSGGFSNYTFRFRSISVTQCPRSSEILAANMMASTSAFAAASAKLHEFNQLISSLKFARPVTKP